MTTPLVSVIVPIYKVEKYLCACVDSILAQTYQNIEIILVDDGSPDNCPKICDDYAQKDSRIRVIHKQNGGLSDARNVGMENANGDYFCFVDSDDFVSPQMVEFLIKPLIDNPELKLSVAQHIQFNDGEPQQIPKYQTVNYKIISSKEYFLSVFQYSAWSKIYKKELFNDVKFPLKRYYEDMFTTYKLVVKPEKLARLDCKLYYYRQMRAGSILTVKPSLKTVTDCYDAISEIIGFFKTYDKEIYERFLVQFVVKYYFFHYAKCSEECQPLLEKWKKQCDEINFKEIPFGKSKIKLIYLRYFLKYTRFLTEKKVFDKRIKFK